MTDRSCTTERLLHTLEEHIRIHTGGGEWVTTLCVDKFGKYVYAQNKSINNT